MILIRDRARDQRIRELNRARKGNLAEICREGDGAIMPLSDYLRWSRHDLISTITDQEFKVAAGTRVLVSEDCTLPTLRGKAGAIAADPVDGRAIKVQLDGVATPSYFVPFELEVTR